MWGGLQGGRQHVATRTGRGFELIDVNEIWVGTKTCGWQRCINVPQAIKPEPSHRGVIHSQVVSALAETPLDAQVRLEQTRGTDARSDTNDTGSGKLNLVGRCERHRVAGIWNYGLQDAGSIVKARLLLHDIRQTIVKQTRTGSNNRISAPGRESESYTRGHVFMVREGRLKFMTNPEGKGK